MIEVRCECGHKLVIFPHHAGTTMPCPKCDATVDVPVPEGGAAPDSPPPPPPAPPESGVQALLRKIRELLGLS